MYTVIPALGKYRQEDYEFEARMDNIERPCWKKERKEGRKDEGREEGRKEIRKEEKKEEKFAPKFCRLWNSIYYLALFIGQEYHGDLAESLGSRCLTRLQSKQQVEL
jgi:hypothetical protein